VGSNPTLYNKMNKIILILQKMVLSFMHCIISFLILENIRNFIFNFLLLLYSSNNFKGYKLFDQLDTRGKIQLVECVFYFKLPNSAFITLIVI
jgi:hypothetical protein